VIPRTLETKLTALARQFPAIFLTGPRQSGKTTLARATFPDFSYVSLEDLDERDFARGDPRGFLRRFESAQGVILDEVQRAPDLLSYLQAIVDRPRAAPYILTGSQQLHLAARVSQTLAGRAAVLSLYPFSLGELLRRQPLDPARFDADDELPAACGRRRDEIIFGGLYPPLHDRGLDPRDFYNGYVRTYVERDVRELTNIGDLDAFARFVAACATRSGQLLNLSSLASDLGVSQPTARRWISVLEACGLVLLLRPHTASLARRLVRTPKLYFLDPGLMCFLLRLRSPADLATHPLHGAVFETFVVSEIHKSFAHRGEPPPLYFWRDRTGHEVDVIIDLGTRVVPVEIKLGETVRGETVRGLEDYAALAGCGGGVLVHGGEAAHRRGAHLLRPWFGCS
jgi:predicted AAA+ superfamily ATPase